MPTPGCMCVALLATLVAAAQGAREGQHQTTSDVTGTLTRSPSTSWNDDLVSNLSTSFAIWSADFASSVTKTTTTIIAATTPVANPMCPGPLLMEPSGTLRWEVGTVKNVTCSVADPSSSLTASDLIMLRGTTSLPSQVTDNYTITVAVEASEPTDYYLICTDANKTNPCVSKVYVGYPPLDVEDFSCVSYNWDSLWCHWTIPYNPAQSNSQDYKPYLITTTTADDEVRGECECAVPEKEGDSCKCLETCCTWQPPQYAIADEFVYVVFRTENDLGSASFKHNVSNYAIVLPNKALHVKAEPTTRSRLVRVTWDMPSGMEVFAGLACVVYRVDHRLADASRFDSTWLTSYTGKCCSETCETQAEVEMEHWWKEYEVRIRLRSGAAPYTLEEDGFWSDWSPTNVTTPPAAPETAPPMGSGTYQVSERSLIVAWRPIPPLLHNGPGFFYQVTATREDQEGVVVAPAEVKESFATFLDLNSSAAYRVEVVAMNDQGRSNVSSVVRVEGTNKLPAEPVLPVVVKYLLGIYELRWSNEDPASSSYTAYVCTDDQEDQTPCTTNLYWKSVGNVSSVNVTLADWDLTEDGSSGVRFAVSAEFSNGASSGMSWDRCGTPRSYQKTGSPPSLSRPTDLHKTTALVPWTLECNDRAAVVKAIEALRCIGNFNFTSQCTGGEKSTHEVLVSDVELTGLQEATQYTVWLRLRYRSGLSEWSNSQTFVTLNGSGLAAWVIGVITSVAVFSSVLIVLFISYSWRRLANMMKEVNREVNLPDGLLHTDPKYLTVADDSGQDSFSLGPELIAPAFASDHAITPNTPSSLRSVLAQVTEEFTGGRRFSQEGRQLPLGEEEDNCINQVTERANAAYVNSGNESSCSPGTFSSTVALPRDSTSSHNYVAVTSFPNDFGFGSLKDETTSKQDPSYGSCNDSPLTYVAVQPHHFKPPGNNGYVSPDMPIRFDPCEAIKNEAKMKKSEENPVDQVTPSTGYVALQHPDFGTHQSSCVLPDVTKNEPSCEGGQASEAVAAPETTQPVKHAASEATVDYLGTGGGVEPLQVLDPSPVLCAKADAAFKPVREHHLHPSATLPTTTKADVNPVSGQAIGNEEAEVNDGMPPGASPSHRYVAVQLPGVSIFGEGVSETTVRKTEVENDCDENDGDITASISKSFPYDAIPTEMTGQAVVGAAMLVDAAPLSLAGSFLKGTASQAAADCLSLDHLIHDNRFEVSEPHDDGERESLGMAYGGDMQEGQEEYPWRDSLASEDLPPGYSRVGGAPVRS